MVHQFRVISRTTAAAATTVARRIVDTANATFQNKEEAALVEGIEIYGVNTLRELVDHIQGVKMIERTPLQDINYERPATHIDMIDIKGQETAKRALLIAAVGGHNICMYGPPGTGKTMLAKSFASILPALTREEIFEVSGIHSVVGHRGDRKSVV